MKKLYVLALVAAFLLVGAQPVFAGGPESPAIQVTAQDEVPTSPVELPIELQALLAAGIGYLVTQGLKSFSKLLNKDLSGWSAAITASVVTSVIYFFNAILSAVPPEAQPSVSIALSLIVSILGAFGVHATVKMK